MLFLSEITILKAVDGFSSIEYLVIFNAIIYGFISSYYFTGWGNMIQNRKNFELSIEHLAWTIFSFIFIITSWYKSWFIIKYININVWFFFFSTVQPLLYYFIAVLLFPLHNNEETNYFTYLRKNKKILFYFYAIACFVSIFNSILYNKAEITEIQIIYRIVGGLIAVIGALTKNKKIHITILTLSFIILLLFLQNTPSISG